LHSFFLDYGIRKEYQTMTIQDKLDSLTEYQLKTVIMWTLNDLKFWGATETAAVKDIQIFARMLNEAVEYQITKAINSTIKEEE